MSKKFVDLSLIFKNNMQKYSANHPKVQISKTVSFQNFNRQISKIIIGSHSGTHVDAPRHFIKNGYTIDKFPPEMFCGNAILLNFSGIKKKTKISIKDVKLKLNKKIIRKKILIFRFDWTDKFYGKKNFYTDHPYLSTELCKWLVKEGVKIIGLDTPQPDDPNNKLAKNDGINHKILLSKNILIIEYLTNLKNIKKENFYFYGFPINIKDADGSPLRAIAKF